MDERTNEMNEWSEGRRPELDFCTSEKYNTSCIVAGAWEKPHASWPNSLVAASGHGKDSGGYSTAALPWGLGGREKFDGGTIDSRQMFRSS